MIYIYVLSNFHDSTPPHPPKKQGEISEIHHLSPFFKPQPRLRKKENHCSTSTKHRFRSTSTSGHSFTPPSSPPDTTGGRRSASFGAVPCQVKSWRSSKQRTPRVWWPDISMAIGSMYGIYANIWDILVVNVTYIAYMDPMGWRPTLRFAQSKGSFPRTKWKFSSLGIWCMNGRFSGKPCLMTPEGTSWDHGRCAGPWLVLSHKIVGW